VGQSSQEGGVRVNDTIVVPAETLRKWLKALGPHRTWSDGEDEDNNYDVIQVCEEIEALLSKLRKK
jgi:hypothetical protein